MTALARRVVACPRWRWLPGMLSIDSRGRLRVVDADAACGVSGQLPAAYLPDLSDPATCGCLLALVRARYGATTETGWCGLGAAPDWTVRIVQYEWHESGVQQIVSVRHVGCGGTEAEALVNALLASEEG